MSFLVDLKPLSCLQLTFCTFSILRVSCQRCFWIVHEKVSWESVLISASRSISPGKAVTESSSSESLGVCFKIACTLATRESTQEHKPVVMSGCNHFSDIITCARTLHHCSRNLLWRVKMISWFWLAKLVIVGLAICWYYQENLMYLDRGAYTVVVASSVADFKQLTLFILILTCTPKKLFVCGS